MDRSYSHRHKPRRYLRRYERHLEISQFIPVDLDIRENALYKKDLVDGEGRVLIKVLERRFGPLPTSIRERIRKADLNSIEAWVDHSATATTLEEIFGPLPTDA